MSDTRANRTVLDVQNLCAGYGARRVLEGVSFRAHQGEIAAIIGPNGSGKSTLLKSILGLIRVFSGRIDFLGDEVTRMPAHQKTAAGVVFLPQGNRVFDELSVMENLQLGGYILTPAKTAGRIEQVLPMFPVLKGMLGRPAFTLSGGERQMLAFARAMILRPKLLMLDEPSVGLSPKLVGEVLGQARQIRAELDCCVLIVEQKVDHVLEIADRALALQMGRLVFDGKPDEARTQAKQLFLA